MKPPIRLLLLAPAGAGDHYHGAGTTFYRMYSRIPKDVLRITLLHGSPQQKKFDAFEEQVFLCNARGRSIKRSYFKKLRFLLSAKHWLHRNAHRFDVLHATLAYPTGLSPAFYGEQLGLPAAVTIAAHDNDLGGHPSWVSRLTRSPQRRQWMITRVSAVLATSQDIYDELIGYAVDPARIHRIPYGVDANQFCIPAPRDKQLLRAQLGWQDEITFLFVGDTVRRKRPHLLLEALHRIVQQGQQCQIAFVGPASDVDYLREMQQYVSSRGLERFVRWSGFQTDVARLYRAADVFVLPSSVEGLPNAMLEAMASGLPVIGTPISGIKDLVHPNRNGFVIKPEADELASRMLHYLKEPQDLTLHGGYSRAIIEKDYSLDAVIPLYVSLFRQLAAQPRQTSLVPSESQSTDVDEEGVVK